MNIKARIRSKYIAARIFTMELIGIFVPIFWIVGFVVVSWRFWTWVAL